MKRPSAAGFTLIEVLAAVLIVSLVFGLLLESVTRNLADLGRARNEARGAALAEQRAREIEQEIAAGGTLELGETEGRFAEPDDDLTWRLAVAPLLLPLPADYESETPPSPLFLHPKAPPPDPSAVPPLRLVELRVFADDVDPETIVPTVFLVTASPAAGALEQAAAQRAQQAEQEGERPEPVETEPE